MTCPFPASVVFVVPRFHTNLYFATKALLDRGHRVTLLCSNAEGIEDHGLLTPVLLPPGTSARTVWSHLGRLSPDLLLVRRVPGLSPVAAAYGLLNRIPTFAYDQRPLTEVRSWRKIAADAVRGRPARRVTPVRGLDHAAPSDRFAVYLPFPVERLGEATEERRPSSRPLRILCVGKLTQPRKNHLLLLDALDALPDDCGWHLTLAGSSSQAVGGADAGHLARLQEAAARNRPGRSVTIRTDVPFAEMPGLYARHDVCVLPARAEPLGSSPLEAMAYGCVPVISSACGSAGSLTPGVDGLVVDVGTPEGLREALEGLARNRKRTEALGRAARATAEGELGPARFAARVEALIANRG